MSKLTRRELLVITRLLAAVTGLANLDNWTNL